MARSELAHLYAKQKYEFLKEKYGNNPDAWKMAGGATLLGAELAEGYSKTVNANIQSANIASRQKEVAERTDISIANIAQQEKKVLGAQTAAFVKGGVKLEGSALDVLQETVSNASEAMAVRQREADFELTQLEIERRLQKSKAQFAQVETLLSMGTTLAAIK